MYLDYFGFSDPPFELTPDPKFLFMTARYREAISNVQYGIEARKGLTVLVGEAGTGKTTALRAALRSMQRTGAIFCWVNNPTLTRNEFLDLLIAGFELQASAQRSKADVLLKLEARLREWRAAGRVVALIVDEAQSLSNELLEEIRLLANMETDDGKLLPLVLAGQPELGERLNAPGLRQIKQRIALRCELRSFDVHETAAYISGRIRKAGGDGARIFTREAVTAIHEFSRGIPRVISVLCDNALVSAFASDTRPVTRGIVLEVAKDFDLQAPATAIEPLPARVATASSERIVPTVNETVPALAAGSLAGSRTFLGVPDGAIAVAPRRRFRFFS